MEGWSGEGEGGGGQSQLIKPRKGEGGYGSPSMIIYREVSARKRKLIKCSKK